MLMVIDTKIDYSAHELQVKRLLKEVHVHLLEQNFKAAAGVIDAAIVELRLMRTAVKSHVKDE
jgi:hypothetical protein